MRTHLPPEAAREQANNELFDAVRGGDVAAVKAALGKGANVNKRCGSDGLTALHLAAQNDDAEVATVLIIAGAKPHLRSKDARQVTPLMLAESLKHYAVFMALKQQHRLVNPLRRRYLGPGSICVLIVVQTLLAFFLTDANLRWHGWKDATGSSGLNRWCYLVFGLLSLLLLLLVHTKDPGYVRREQVAYVDLLWNELENPNRVVVDDDLFGVAWPGGETQLFTWCYSCKLWRPPNVSHCTTCRRCSWRFDHHCDVVGACIAAGNHLAFTSFLMVSSLSWMLTVASVCWHYYRHGAFASLSLANIHEGGLGNWPVYLCIIFVVFGAVGSVKLLKFGCFHASALLFNHNTKMLSKQRDNRGSTWQLNSSKVLGQIFCAPCEFRNCGAPESLPLPLLEVGMSNKQEARPCLEQSSTFSGSESDLDVMV